MIDTTFDFRSDTPPGRDLDTYSPTLRRYHQLLWSKRLPGLGGADFDLDDTSGVYLHHRPKDSDYHFRFSSDQAIPSLERRKGMRSIIAEVDAAENEKLWAVAYTIGALLIFPSNKVGRGMTINGAKGLDPTIVDRLDLTLVSIQRYYRRHESRDQAAEALGLLDKAVQRYPEFFSLFGNFRGYVNFFLLQDLVTDDTEAVKLFCPAKPALPRDVESYKVFRRSSIEFIEARNQRIHEWDAAHLN